MSNGYCTTSSCIIPNGQSSEVRLGNNCYKNQVTIKWKQNLESPNPYVGTHEIQLSEDTFTLMCKGAILSGVLQTMGGKIDVSGIHNIACEGRVGICTVL